MSGQLLHHPPIAVDFWKLRDCSHVRLFFLSHMHSDHTEGLTPSWSRPIYCSPVTRLLLLDQFKLNPQHVHSLELNDVHCLRLAEETNESLSVTLIDANHCPGAVMFLFEGYFGRILYTGDFRYSQSLNGEESFARACSTAIDKLYLDNTFCSQRCDFPSREKSMAEILRIISEHPNHRVMIGLRKLGKESLLVAVAKYFHTRIFVTEERLRRLELLKVPNVFTTVESEARIIVVDQGLIRERNVNLWNEEMQTIAIIPTALYRVLNISKALNRADVFVVPYSDHSSFSELCEFVATVRPRAVIPILTSVKDRLGKTIPERGDMSCFAEYLDESPSLPFSPPIDFTVVKQDVVRSRNRVAVVDGSVAASVKSKKFKFRNVGRPKGVVYEHAVGDEQSQDSATLSVNDATACNKDARTNDKALENSNEMKTVEGNGFIDKTAVDMTGEDYQQTCVAENTVVWMQKNVHTQSEPEEAFRNVKAGETIVVFNSCRNVSELALNSGLSDKFEDVQKQGECDSMRLVEREVVEYAYSCHICKAHSDVTFPVGSSHVGDDGLKCKECSSQKLAVKVVKGRADNFNSCQPCFVQSVSSEPSKESECVQKGRLGSSVLSIDNNNVGSYSVVANTDVSQLPSSNSEFITSQNGKLFKTQCSESNEEITLQVSHEQLKLSDLILESLQPIFADEAQNMFDNFLRSQNKH